VDKVDYYLNEIKTQIEQGNLAGTESLINAVRNDFELAPMHMAYLAWYQAKLLYTYGRFEQAQVEVRKAILMLTDLAGQESTLAKAINLLANISIITGQIVQANREYQQALVAAKRGGEQSLISAILVNIVTTYMYLDRRDESQDALEQAQLLAEASGDEYMRAITYNQMAVMYSTYGPFSSAIRWVDAALKIQSSIPQVADRVTILINASATYYRYGDFKQAQQFADEVELLVLAHPNIVGWDAVLILKAILSKQKGDIEGWHSLALQSWQEHSTFDRNAEAANQLARYHTYVGQYSEARRYVNYLRGDGMSDRPPHAEDIDRLDAGIYAAERSWDLADRYYQSAIDQLQGVVDNYNLAEVKEEYAALLMHWAEASEQVELFERALELAQQAHALFEVLELPHRTPTVQALTVAINKRLLHATNNQ